MFVSTHAFGPFDHLRVPYVTSGTGHGAGDGRLRRRDATEDAPALCWARPTTRSRTYAGVFEVAGCRLAGEVATEAPASLDHEGRWRERWPVRDDEGQQVAGVWVHDHGDVWLPFDPGEVMQCLWSEGYTRLGAGRRLRADLRQLAVRGYYVLRPALPRRVQLLLRKRLARRSPGPSFPSWPLHTGLHDLYDWLMDLASRVADGPVPWVAPWPDGHEWCLVLTHDVETAQGVQDIELLRRAERAGGYRSSWNFVPERYVTPVATLERLREEGCEIGVHGLRHDGRDLASPRALRSRLPGMRAAAERWGATGFRSPATQRSWELMPRLGFDYDSSSTDTDPYEPQPGGCCSFLPFFNQGLVELPITLPQDHTLFTILGHRDGALWVSKARELRARDGLVLVLSHPDYAHGAAAVAWESLLAEFGSDLTMWQPLARDAARWWRDRAASRLVRDEAGWRVEGPAAERARVRLVDAQRSGSVA